jgi:pyruvate dehydrogenase E2 component (dihydrolipoamide acetyltransferase)
VAVADIQAADIGNLSEPERRPPPAAPLSVADENFVTIHASPSIRRFARELGVDLSLVSGSSRKGRITREDVQQFVKQVMSGYQPAPATAASCMGSWATSGAARCARRSLVHTPLQQSCQEVLLRLIYYIVIS